jgi:hypothetical protein
MAAANPIPTSGLCRSPQWHDPKDGPSSSRPTCSGRRFPCHRGIALRPSPYREWGGGLRGVALFRLLRDDRERRRAPSPGWRLPQTLTPATERSGNAVCASRPRWPCVIPGRDWEVTLGSTGSSASLSKAPFRDFPSQTFAAISPHRQALIAITLIRARDRLPGRLTIAQPKQEN